MKRREVLISGASVAVGAMLGGLPIAWAAGKPIKLGYNVATLANPFFQGMTKGVVDAAAKFPDMTLLNTNANGDANTQSTMVVDLINQGVDALILNPINANSIVPVVDDAGNVILAKDEYPRPQTTAEGLASLKPSFEALADMPPGSFDQEKLALLRAMLDDASGRADAAMSGYRPLFEAKSRPIAAEAQLRAVKLADADSGVTINGIRGVGYLLREMA